MANIQFILNSTILLLIKFMPRIFRVCISEGFLINLDGYPRRGLSISPVLSYYLLHFGLIEKIN